MHEYHNSYTRGDHFWVELVYDRRSAIHWRDMPARVIVFAYHDINDNREPDYSSWIPTYVTMPYDMAD